MWRKIGLLVSTCLKPIVTQKCDMFWVIKNVQFYEIDAVNWMKRVTDPDQINRGRFQEAIGNVLAFAQFFAMMPLVGVTKSSTTGLHFKWRCIRTIYATIIFITAAIYLSILIILTLSREMTFNSIGKSIKQTFQLNCKWKI